ncbi:MAG: hypothetical protein JXA57_09595 [Armatimonadetes bacterium]|nr:hypothetical protein [Armatimonadota bacterium]
MSGDSPSYSPDIPLEDPKDDGLHRWKFAQGVADVVAGRAGPDPIVVGISGEWGEGKTTVLNFIAHALAAHEHIKVVRYNPWRFGGEDELLIGFFLGLSRSLGVSIETFSDKIRRKLSRHIQAVAAIVGKPEVGAAIHLLLRSPDVEEFKNRLESELAKTKRRVVVLIDDIDRLARDEVCAVFRLVKLTASFKYLSYVLAFDREMVSGVLSDRYGWGSDRHGSSFVDKIVQIPLRLPRAHSRDLDELCSRDITAALSASGIQLEERKWNEFAVAFTGTLEASIRTPRHSKVYANALMFALPILKGEVNPVDLMLLQGMSVFYPRVYKAVHDHRDLFLRSGLAVAFESEEKLNEQTQRVVEEACEGLSGDERVSILKLLKTVFPRVETAYGGATYGSDWGDVWSRDQRAASSDYFDRYFSLSIPDVDVPDADIDRVVAASSTARPEELESSLRNLITERNADVAIRKLRTRVTNLGDVSIANLIRAVASIGDRLPNPPPFMDPLTPSARAAILIGELLQGMTDASERIDLFTEVIGSRAPLPFALECFRWIKVNKEDIPDPKAFTPDDRATFGRVLAARIAEAVRREGKPIFVAFPEETRHMLAIWSGLGEPDEAAAHIESTLKSEPGLSTVFLRRYLPQVISEDDPVPRDGDFRREQYESIARILSPSIIADALVEHHGEAVFDPTDDGYFRDSPDDLQLAKQFMRIHQHVETHGSSEDLGEAGDAETDRSGQ